MPSPLRFSLLAQMCSWPASDMSKIKGWGQIGNKALRTSSSWLGLLALENGKNGQHRAPKVNVFDTNGPL
jgi:hypothetical protein